MEAVPARSGGKLLSGPRGTAPPTDDRRGPPPRSPVALSAGKMAFLPNRPVNSSRKGTVSLPLTH